MRYDVFLSYSHADREFALALCERLQRAGLTVFIDEKSIGFGASITGEILETLRWRVTYPIVILSSNSVSSSWVAFEVGVARSANKPVVPYIIDRRASVPSFLSDIRSITTRDGEDRFVELFNRRRERADKATDDNNNVMTIDHEELISLVNILEHRVSRILAGLAPHYRYVEVSRYIERFKALHREHNSRFAGAALCSGS